jgi:hypothetical protein
MSRDDEYDARDEGYEDEQADEINAWEESGRIFWEDQHKERNKND